MKTNKTTILLSLTAFVILGTITIVKSGAALFEPTVQTQTIKFEKGQLLDVLTLTRMSGTDEMVNEYFGKVFPAAAKHGFKMEAQFMPIGAPTMGNYSTDVFALMSWPDENSRQNFDREAASMTYDYKAQRKKIWSTFNLSLYDEQSDGVEFEVREDKIYVVTVYWVDDMQAFTSSKAKSASKMRDAGGALKFRLGKGTSPMGYMWEPDVISITEWPNEEVFDKYIADRSAASPGVKNVNQWKTKFNFSQSN